MKYLMIALLLATTACDEPVPDTAEQAATRAQCKQLFGHIVQISPQVKGKSVENVVAKLPYEDYDGCMAKEHEIRECMLIASDVAGVKKCIPADDIVDCMKRARDIPDVRAKCWGGDAHAADNIKPVE